MPSTFLNWALLLILAFAAFLSFGQTYPNGKITTKLFYGWNLISSASKPINIGEIDGCNLIKAYWYNGKDYEVAETLEPMKGYWVFSEYDCVAGFPKGRNDSNQSMHKGWNMISSRKSWNEIKNNCSALTQIYWWNPSKRKYEKVEHYTKLEDYKGYWVYVKNSCFISEREKKKPNKPRECVIKVNGSIKKAVESAGENCTVIIPEGNYDEGWINIPEGVKIKGFGENTVIKLPAHKTCGDYIFSACQPNIAIENLSLDGNKKIQKPRAGCEWDFGIAVHGSSRYCGTESANPKNILIRNLRIKDFAGDGIYIGLNNDINNVTVKNARIWGNFRNGISITSGKNIKIIYNYVDGTSGYWGGGVAVDIEPNSKEWTVENTLIAHNKYKGTLLNLCGRGICRNVEWVNNTKA